MVVGGRWLGLSRQESGDIRLSATIENKQDDAREAKTQSLATMALGNAICTTICGSISQVLSCPQSLPTVAKLSELSPVGRIRRMRTPISMNFMLSAGLLILVDVIRLHNK